MYDFLSFIGQEHRLKDIDSLAEKDQQAYIKSLTKVLTHLSLSLSFSLSSSLSLSFSISHSLFFSLSPLSPSVLSLLLSPCFSPANSSLLLVSRSLFPLTLSFSISLSSLSASSFSTLSASHALFLLSLSPSLPSTPSSFSRVRACLRAHTHTYTHLRAHTHTYTHLLCRSAGIALDAEYKYMI